MLSSGGVYLIDVIDNFCVGIPMASFGLMEIVGFAWIYGYKNISLNVEEMVGHKPMRYLELAWAIFLTSLSHAFDLYHLIWLQL